MNDVLIFNVARLGVRSALSVAAAWPRPGLPTPIDAAQGVDHQMLVDAALAMFPCLINCASIGAEMEAMKPDDVISLLRSAGRHGEVEVLQATRGRVASRGRLFFLGLLAAAAGRLDAQGRNLTPMALTLSASSFVRGIVHGELEGLDGPTQGRTPGERAYMLHGIEGCRGEAERGLPSTLRAVELLGKMERDHASLAPRERVAHVLLHVMGEVEDACVVANEGIEGMIRVRGAARAALSSGGMLTPEGRAAIAAMDEAFRERGTVPRASEVVLCAALFVIALGELLPTRSGHEE